MFARVPSSARNKPSQNWQETSPILHGSLLFRPGVQVYVNRSDEAFSEYMGIAHRHDFLEIVQVISGHGLHRVGDAEYETAPGDLFIINHNVPHGFFPPHPGAPLDLVVYNCVFTPSFLDASLLGADQFSEIAQSYLFRALFPNTVLPDADIRLTGADFEAFGALFDSMQREYREGEKGYEAVIRASLITLLIKMFRLLSVPTPESAEVDPVEKTYGFPPAIAHGDFPTSTDSLHQEIVRKAMAYMKQNATAELRLEHVAMQSFVSKHHFSRLFHEVTGIRFSEHVQQLRIEEAIRLLREGQGKVADVALACGFHDLKHFYTVFRRHTGKTPGAFRSKS